MMNKNNKLKKFLARSVLLYGWKQKTRERYSLQESL